MSGSNVYQDENGVLIDTETGVGFTVSLPSMARVHNFWHCGKDYFRADEEAAARVDTSFNLAAGALAARTFQYTATEKLIAEHGIAQLLDLGVGLPVPPYLHEIAVRLNPAVRVVYADYDPLVAAHARVLLDIQPKATYRHGDFADPAAMLAELRALLDLSQPVAVSLISVLEYVSHDPIPMLATLHAHLAPGSYLMLASLAGSASERASAQDHEDLEALFRACGLTFRDRTKDEFTALFDGFELLDPGVVPVDRWAATADEDPCKLRPRERLKPTQLPCYVGLARKP
ncbi:SAM-dependent methyltransferase [Nocardia brasiliensis]|uniref:SAM-dependent methyltransferase n=1 Tax=Nocardia brasiliensis TaxID=37326 RepID=UPI0024548F74|nr:SAM-dependent methyltransferase [Nocardia brasiliensis]